MIDYAIVDFQNRKNLCVAYETRDERSANEIASYLKGSDCEVYYETESNGKPILFRVICEKSKVVSSYERKEQKQNTVEFYNRF